LNNLEAWREAGEYFLLPGVKNVIITLGSKAHILLRPNGSKDVVDAEQGVKDKDTTEAGFVFIVLNSTVACNLQG
jgi:hypothetical protein